ncbi:transcriptional regulator [Clostridium sp. ASBs410]|jgi:DNA-binding MarR family transcriptional regulator|nr:transcriptional regulator [Clostridium sp. ASBs410]
MPDTLIENLGQIDQLYQSYNALYQEIAGHFSVSYSGMLILYALGSKQPYTQKELGEALFLPKQTVHSSINAFIKSGLVISKPSEKNQRIKEIFLTPEGEELANKTVRLLLAAEQSAAAQLTEEEMTTLFRLTQKHLNLLQKEINQAFNL